MDPNAPASPRTKARFAGVCEALEGITSSGGQVFILGKLVAFHNPATTAANITAHEGLFWFGFILSILGVAFHIAWTLLFYQLFKPVHKTLAQLAALVSIIVCGLQALTAFLYLCPFLILNSGGYVTTLSTPQLQDLAILFFRLNAYAFEVDLVFFGFFCVLTGYLIFKSTFLPRLLGILLMVDGVGWAFYMYPPLANQLFTFIAAASGLAEIPLQLWLLIKGVNSERWNQQAAVAAQKPGVV
ncbi:MAG TPA: DUF4386 domain-containing protein [Candidatus Acidoferrum sp.]|jgi:hypothetical protein